MAHPISGKIAFGTTITVAVAATVAMAALNPDSQIFGRTLVAGNDPNEIALTYDDRPNESSTPPLLELPARFGVRATFFMIGKFVRSRTQIVREVQAAGHLIGNHTLTHPFLATRSSAVITDELRGCNQALEDVIGEWVRYFRAPFGARRPAVLRIARELGLTPVQWNVQGNDWEPIGADGILRKIDAGIAKVRQSGRGANVLLHDGFDQMIDYDRSATVRATELLLRVTHEQGMRAVAVDEWDQAKGRD